MANYSAGTYGGDVYGGGGGGGGGGDTQTLLEADTWQLDAFGDLLVGCFTGDGKIYTWDGNAANNFVQATGSPTSCRAVVVTPERFLVALGAGGDPRKVQWASQETTDTWTPLSTNSAGDFPLSTRGRIMAGRATRRQTLIWTDVDLHTMTYIGGTLIYSFDQAGDNCGLLAPNAIAMAGTLAFWMSKDNFFSFDGFVNPIPCDVRDHVFTNINEVQRSKITSHTISEFNEVWWHYPSAGSVENDRYVVYNYGEGHWTVGQFGRAATIDKGPTVSPVMVTHDGFVFEHEVDFTTGYEGAADLPFLESGPFELGDGDNTVRVQRVVPDENSLGSVAVTLYSSMFPTGTETLQGPYTIQEPTDVRFTAKLVRLKFIPTAFSNWRIGIMRVGGIEGGRR